MPRPRTPRHALPARLPEAVQRLDSRLGDGAIRIVATAAAGLILLSAGAASGGASSDVTQLAAERRAVAGELLGEVAPVPIVLPERTTSRVRKIAVAQPLDRAGAPARRSAAQAPVKRWLPTGTGMWLHDFTRSQGGNARAIVNRSQQLGLSTLYVQTGSTRKGWIGTPALSKLLPATKGTGIKVIAWDFPKLINPTADAMRMVRAARFTCAGCPRVAAVAPDVETAAEGTRLTNAGVRRYYQVLRAKLPRDIAILATVPWPSEMRTGSYPYALTAKYSDAMLPMAYWYNRSPAVVTTTSMQYLARFRKPVMPVGQGYDGRIDAPYLAPDPTPGLSVMAFMQAAKKGGATHVSLWSWQTTGRQQWHALALAHKLFRVPS